MIKYHYLIICFLLLCSHSYCLGQSAKSDSLYSIGVTLFDEGKYDKAIPYFVDSYTLDCAELDTLSPRRYYSADWLAYCYYKTDNIAEAKKINKISYKSKPIDRRLTYTIDSLSTESNKDFMNKLFFSALKKADEIDRLESIICEENSFFHVGTYQMKANCYSALQKLDSALYYLQKVREIEKIYFEEFDTLSVGTLNGLFYLNLNLHQYEAAKSYNEELTKILEHNFDSKHFLNAETNYQRLILYLYQREWWKAHEALPEYLNILKYCFGNDPETYKRTILTIRNNFEMCGRYDDVEFIDSYNIETIKSNKAIGPKERFEVMSLQYMNNLQSKDSLNYDRIEKEMIQLLDSYPDDSLKEQRALMLCLQTMHLLGEGNLFEAQNTFLKFQKDSLEQYLDEQTDCYYIYLITKGTICAFLDDFEECISDYTKVLGRMDVVQQRQYPNISAQVACMHAMVGHYQKAREMTDKAIRDYKQYIVDTGASFRLDVDTMRVGQIVEQIQTYMSNSRALPDSAVYMLREIKSNYLLLKAELLKNTRRYQIGEDYYKCISDYARELVKMRKYIEVQAVMNKYVAEWKKCYYSIDEKSEEWDDVFDRALATGTLGAALRFRSRICYEKGDKTGVSAHKDYIEFVKEEFGEESNEYLNAMIHFYEYIGDNKSMLMLLSSALDTSPDNYYPNAFKLAADTYQKENQPELSLKYRKGFVAVSLRDSTARKDKEYEILSAVNNIVEYYIKAKKDTLALYHYYQDELWPSLDVCEDDYIKYFMRSINELCFDIDDDSFIPFVEKEVERKNQLYSSPIIQGCVDQVIAGVLSRGKNKKGRAIEYIKNACKEVETDSLLHLLFSCRLHEVFAICAPDSNAFTINLGDNLMKQMGQKEEWKYTHEYAELIERQLKLLQKEQHYDEIVSLCHSYHQDFTNKRPGYLNHILNSKHPMYESIDFLNDVTLNSWSSDMAIPAVNEALYTALSIRRPQDAGVYALNLVHDSYDDIESSLDINYISTWKCDKLISQTSKLAYKHQTDSLKMYAYDASLLCKGLKLRSDYAIRAIIQQSGHISALRKYDELHYTLRLLENAAEDRIDSLQNRVKALERDLFRLSEFFGDYKKSLYNSWKDVQTALKDDDIAIEFTIVKKDYDDMYVRCDSTFSEGFYACVLRKGMPWPEIVYICETDNIDTSLSIYSHTDVTRKLLEPLSQYLNGVRNIFFSPIGQLNQLSIESLPQPKDSTKTLSQMYNFYRLSSTRELIPKSYHFVGTNAVVYGGLAYDATIDIMKRDAENYIESNIRDIKIDESVDVNGVRSVIADIPYLAGTKIEANNVAHIINSANDTLLVAQTYEGVKGTEASFKSLNRERKRIIHLATHGFYFNEKETDKVQSLIGKDLKKRKEDQSLMRSGLFLTGAENKYQGEVIPEGIEDGILTAQEIANTDLSGLDLCVLSACQTAQGDISSEGVFGLQRGFKKAGAQSILMSLWKVDDEATCLLMTEFYKNWLGEKMTKHDALEKAKRTVRSHKEKGWDDPKYWAAFILLDGLD